ncbi:MAG: FAD-dependent oxidoreductase [Tyzzerella sp.]|nr:FAD-dependent oxidoreductase [Tyzzerella sp.]
MYKIEVKTMPEYDVIVVGGGVAGVAAAVAASRNGAKTLLMEKTVILGGLATAGLISWYEPLCDGEGKQMIHGIAEELIKLSVKYGFENLPEKWGGTGKNPSHHDRYATHFSPNIFALALIEYLEENGVSLRLDTLATYPDMEDGLCKGILVETVGGREYFPAKMVVDATGDACICERAGIPTELGENYLTYVTHELNYEGAKKLAETSNFCKGRKWKSTGSDLAGNGHPEGVPTIRVRTADDVTEYMLWGGKKVLERLKTEDKESRDILTLPSMPQFRKIRRIIGETEFDGNEDGVHIENSVGSFGDFRKRGRHFELPYTTLYNRKVGNLFAAGRIISAKDDGWELTRVIPVAALSGEAAGKAAALCVKENCTNHELDIKLFYRKFF